MRADPELPDDDEEMLYMVFKEAQYADRNKMIERTTAEGQEELTAAEAHANTSQCLYI